MKNSLLSLIEGYQKFRELHFEEGDTFYADLVRQGQRPKALMVACSDSRVDPALVMNSQPGDLFVIRNVANIVPPYEDDHHYHGTSAALEFGVTVLGIPHVILFGHTMCGGIQSLFDHSCDDRGEGSFLGKWMSLAQPAHDSVEAHHGHESLSERVTLCGQYSLVNSLNNLRTFPWVRKGVDEGTLRIHAWNFNMSDGVIEAYNEEENCFKPVEEEFQL